MNTPHTPPAYVGPPICPGAPRPNRTRRGLSMPDANGMTLQEFVDSRHPAARNLIMELEAAETADTNAIIGATADVVMIDAIMTNMG